MIRVSAVSVAVAACLGLSACAVGPDYVRPDTPAPAVYKELGDWQPAKPQDAALDSKWWEIYNDPKLNELEQKLMDSNQSLKAALASYAESRALLDSAKAGFWPTLSANGGLTRSQRGTAEPANNYTLGGSASWEADVWGRVRRSVESSKASAEASAFDLADTRLSLQATLATDYFELRAQDALQDLLDATVAADQQSLTIAQNRYNSGVAAKADVVTAQTQLLSVQAQQLNAGILRAQLEHAIAVLTGESPAEFALAKTTFASAVPGVPVGVPSTLLQRRPDVAAAERSAASASAQIGVAVAAWFPSLTLGASGSFSNNTLSNLLTIPNRVWSIGPSLAATLFDGGARNARIRQAHAAYDLSVAQYRQSVLTAFQQVEDDLANLRILEKQAALDTELVRSAHEAETLTLNQYRAGTVPFSSVISAQTTTLSSEQTALTVLRSRLVGSVALISSLGGGVDPEHPEAATK
ncbi:MAG: efflux transporter outer membrane subunit [Pseudomonadota bacterium]